MLCPDASINSNLSYLLRLVFAVLMIPCTAWCSDDELAPYLRLRQEYSDNLFMSTANTLDDFILTVSPGLRLSRKSERVNLNLDGYFDHATYFENSDLNGNDVKTSGRISISATERLSLSADAAFASDSRSDRDLEDTGLVLDTTRRDRYQGGVSGDFLFSERTSANLSGSWQQDDYQSPQDNANDLQAYSTSMGIFHQPARCNRRTTVYSNLQFSRYKYEQSAVDYYAVLAGLDNRFRETIRIRFDLGARYTRSEFQTTQLVFIPPFEYAIVPAEEKTATWGGVGQVSLTYEDDFIRCAVNASHDIEPASGRQGSTERTSIRASFGRRFSQELRLDMDAGYYFNNAEKDQFSSVAINEKTFRGNFQVRYDISRPAFITGGWSYTRIRDSIADITADRNLVYISVSYTFEIY